MNDFVTRRYGVKYLQERRLIRTSAMERRIPPKGVEFPWVKNEGSIGGLCLAWNRRWYYEWANLWAPETKAKSDNVLQGCRLYWSRRRCIRLKDRIEYRYCRRMAGANWIIIDYRSGTLTHPIELGEFMPRNNKYWMTGVACRHDINLIFMIDTTDCVETIWFLRRDEAQLKETKQQSLWFGW